MSFSYVLCAFSIFCASIFIQNWAKICSKNTPLVRVEVSCFFLLIPETFIGFQGSGICNHIII